MFYNAKEHTLKFENTQVDYITFGKGDKSLVMIPGLNTQGVKGSAIMLACMYRIFAKDYKVYVFDRKTDIPSGYTVKDISRDIAKIMDMLKLQKADVFGVSQGGKGDMKRIDYILF